MANIKTNLNKIDY